MVRLSQARQRLGSESLQWLFRHTAAQWAHQEAGRHRWRGLALYALDGVVWRTPDAPDNRQAFGGQRNHPEHQSPFPQVRMACSLEARARLLVDAVMDTYSTSEYTLAEKLYPVKKMPLRWFFCRFSAEPISDRVATGVACRPATRGSPPHRVFPREFLAHQQYTTVLIIFRAQHGSSWP